MTQSVEKLQAANPVVETAPAIPAAENVNIESLKITLAFSLEKLNEFQTTVAQNLENLGTELVNAPVWNEAERAAMESAFVEIHSNYYEYVAVIDAMEEQARLLLSTGQNNLKEDGLSNVFDAYANLNQKLNSYKQKMQELVNSLAKVQATLPNVSLGESSRSEYEDLSRNTLGAVNNFLLNGVETLSIKDDPKTEADKKHNQEINFIYNTYSQEDFKNLSGSFIDLENKLINKQKAIADKAGVSVEQLVAIMNENSFSFDKKLQDLFLIKNYFDLQPGLAEKLEKKVQYIEYVKNNLLETYNTEKDQALLKEKVLNLDFYNAAHLREFVKDRIINDPTISIIDALQDKQDILTEIREAGGKELKVENVEEPAVGKEETIQIDPKSQVETVATNDLEEAFFAKGEKAAAVSEKITKKLAEQSLSDNLEIEEMPKSEYEAAFWKANPALEKSFNNYLAELSELAATQPENVKARLDKVAATNQEYVKNYILDNYAAFSNEELLEDLQKYLVDQRVAFEELKFVLSGQEKEIELEASDLIDISDEEISNEFWNKHHDLEVKMEKYANEMMEIKDRIEAMAPENKIDDWTKNVLDNIENHIKENVAKQSDAEIVDWIDKYLEEQLANVQNLEIKMKEDKAIPVTDDMIISDEEITQPAASPEIDLDESDIEYIDDKPAAVPPPIPARANDEAAQVASALASFGEVVPKEEEIDLAKAAETLGKISPVEKPKYESKKIMDTELKADLDKLFAQKPAVTLKKKEAGQPMVSGVLETDMKSVKDLGIKKAEAKIVAPPDSVPFTSAEEAFFAKGEKEGERNDLVNRMEIALTDNKQFFDWIKIYLNMRGYEARDLQDIREELNNNDFVKVLEEGAFLFDSFETLEEHPLLEDFKEFAEKLSPADRKKTKISIEIEKNKYISMTAEAYLELIEARVKFLTKRIGRDVAERDKWKKGKTSQAA